MNKKPSFKAFIKSEFLRSDLMTGGPGATVHAVINDRAKGPNIEFFTDLLRNRYNTKFN